MAPTDLLAIIPIGDEDNPSLARLSASLPKGAFCIHQSPGFLGSIDDYILSQFGEKNPQERRTFRIYAGASLGRVDLSYFAAHMDACIVEIDELELTKTYTNTLFGFYTPHELSLKGDVREIVDTYQRLIRADPADVFEDDLRNVEGLDEKLAKKLFGMVPLDRTKPTYVAIGIGTPDGKYLIGAKNRGPFTLPLDGHI